MTCSIKARVCLATLGLPISGAVMAQTNPSFINDSTSARYRYEVMEYTVAHIPEGTEIEQIDLSERDMLTSQLNHSVVSQGVDHNYLTYFQVQNLESTYYEDWMSSPDYILLAPSGSYGFSASGEQEFYFPSKDSESQHLYELADQYSVSGYTPIMLFFPSIHDEFVGQAEQEGAILQELENNGFRLIWPESEITFDRENKTIHELSVEDSKITNRVTKFKLFDPYGYVIETIYSESTRTDLPAPVTFVTRSSHSNHVIEDYSYMIPKYTDLAHIEVHPIPVENEYTIVLNGIPDAQVSQVQVRDYQGNILFTHVNPDVSQDMIELSGSEYPSGLLIILVYTQNGVYTETITKS